MRTVSAILFGIMLTPFASAAGTVRVAVIADAEDKDLAALVTTELSADPAIALVERDDLAKIGDELKLQQLAGNDAVALGKLAKADGLLFIDKRADGPHVRFTAVNLGYALFDQATVAQDAPVQEAKAIAHLVAGNAAKLKLDPARAIPVSILNLRSDVSTPNATKVERDLTLLLESRLAAIPEIVVLERRHAWDLGFEHSLAPTSRLLEGQYVLDGTLRITGPENGEVSAQVRLHDPKSKQETPLAASGTADDLPALAEAMVGQIVKAIGVPTSATTAEPSTEAREYLREGIWAWEHGQPQSAVEALDSAELLGETAPDLLAARIQALCQIAVPDMNPAEIEFIGDTGAMPILFSQANPAHDYTVRLPLGDRVAVVKRALADLAVYAEPSGQRSFRLQILDPKWQHNVQLAYAERFVIHAASRVLTELDAQSDPEAGPFREQVRQATGFDPQQGKMPRDQADAAFFADEWAHSQQEECAYYREILSAPGTQGQFQAVFLKDRFISQHGTIFCPRFIPDPAEQRKAFVQFAQDLAQTPEGKLSGLLILSGDIDRAVGEAAYPAFLDELGIRRVELVQSREISAHCLAAYELYQRSNAVCQKFGGHAVPVLRCFLTQSATWDIRTLQVLWIPATFPRAEAPDIWKEFLAYKARILDPKNTAILHQEESMFGAFESDFNRAFPDAIEAPKNPLVVTRFWQPGLNEGTGLFFYINEGRSDADSVAWKGFNFGESHAQKIYVLHLPDFKAEKIDLPEGSTPYAFAFKAGTLCLVGFDGSPADGKSHLYQYDRAQKSWQPYDTPPSYSRPYFVRDRLYFNPASSNNQDSGIATCDLATQSVTLLASNRRRPAQNQFDDRRGYQVRNIFPGCGGSVGVSIDFQCYTLDEKPVTWPEVIPGYAAQQTLSLGDDRTALLDYKNKIGVLIDPAKPAPENLWTQPGQALPPALAAYGKPRWTIDAATFNDVFASQGNAGMHGDAFYVLVRHQTVPPHYELFWLDHHGETATRIPLQFKVEPAVQDRFLTLTGLPKESGVVQKPELDPFPVQLVPTNVGICLYHPSAGVWFIPYSDIEAYLKSKSP
jgi:hypothetical protein